MNKAMRALRNHTAVPQDGRPQQGPREHTLTSETGTRPARPLWWWLLAAFLAFAVIVTGAFVWQRSTRVTAQKITDELVALDPNISESQLENLGYVYGGEAVGGYRGYSTGEDYPWYQNPDTKRIDAFLGDVRAGRESVLRLVVRGTGPYSITTDAGSQESSASGGVSVRILWFDPNADADWAEKDSSVEPATIHHDGKGQIREWWWRGGEIVTSDKRFSRAISANGGAVGGGVEYVLKHQPAIPSDPDSADTVIIGYDEVLYSLSE
ncbi:hypothetical protein BLI708_01920 [Bifidobacterium imperatoris]|uniref:Uncharacterized protein n=1 Tax=Bifidobacterium imperatoris TaxID=2020965 RepID=A0A2N5IR98_9BIFI|nr:hypothetical protein [Bifidobacterium imperatoris]PLS24476.1 hypothetical protein Tam1G_1466 [Bifidobacterium imperatoris]QSY58104.1 hypothetical protein BLI708_01920 [Bifidobacterium imperatoris]